MISQQQIERFEAAAARSLWIGVYGSALFLVAGLIAWAVGTGAGATRLLDAGLLILMVTPLLRVVVSLVEYLRVREWFFAAACGIVLLMLLASALSAAASR
jgi:uncharacterized membrane protein